MSTPRRPSNSKKKRPVSVPGLDPHSPTSVLHAVRHIRTMSPSESRSVLHLLSSSALTKAHRDAFHDHPGAFDSLARLAGNRRDVVKVCALRVISALCFDDPINACHAVAAGVLSAVAGMLTMLSADGAQLEGATALMYLTSEAAVHGGEAGGRSAVEVLSDGDASCEELLPNLVDLIAEPPATAAVRQVLLRLVAQLAGYPAIRTRLVMLGCVSAVMPLVADPMVETARCAMLSIAGLSYDDLAREQLAEPWFLGIAASIVSMAGSGEQPSSMVQLASLSLASITFDAKTHEAVVSAGCVHALADAAEAGDAITRRESLKALMNIAAWNGSHAAMRSSGVATMLAGFLAGSHNEQLQLELQEQQRLKKLASRDDDDSTLASTSSTSSSSSSSSSHSTSKSAGLDSPTLLLTLGTLAHLCADESMRDEFYQCGGLVPVISLLRRRSQPAAVELATTVLTLLCDECEERRSAVRDSGAISFLIQILDGEAKESGNNSSNSSKGGAQNPSANKVRPTSSMKMRAARAIAALSASPEIRDAMVADYGILNPLLDMLVSEDSQDITISAWLVQCMSRSRVNAANFRDSGGLPLIMSALSNQCDDEPRGACLRALATLVSFDPNATKTLVNIGAAGMIVAMLSDSETSPQIALRLLVVVHGMCLDNDVRGSLLDAEIVPQVATFAQSSDAATRGVAAKVLDLFGIKVDPPKSRGDERADAVHNNQGSSVVNDGGESGDHTSGGVDHHPRIPGQDRRLARRRSIVGSSSSGSSSSGSSSGSRSEGIDEEAVAAANEALAASSAPERNPPGTVSRAINAVTTVPTYLMSLILMLFNWLYVMDESQSSSQRERRDRSD